MILSPREFISHSFPFTLHKGTIIVVMFIPSKYFNSKTIKSSDFYSPQPPPPNPIHPDPINLSGGRPNAGFYPIQSIDLHIQEAPFSKTTTKTSIPLNSTDGGLDISQGLNYAPGQGYPQLLDLVSKIGEFHGATDKDSLLTSGSGDSLNKILGTLLDHGDTVLVESYTYTPVFATFEIHGATMVPYPVNFKTDGYHLDPENLETLLKNWDISEYKDLKFPKFLFTVPTQNPSGLISSNELISKILKIAELYNLLIIEDDPDGFIRHLPRIHTDYNYYTKEFDSSLFLQYTKTLHDSSYLSTNSPRVLHLGTFSKTISPGIRLGFIIAHPDFISRLTEYSKIITKAPSGFSQVILWNLINSWGGLNGYLKWCYKVSLEYTIRVNSIFDALKATKSVETGYLIPIRPGGGMFFIIKVDLPVDEFEKLRYKFVKYGVLVILGHLMSFDKQFNKNANFIRLTLANVEKLDELIQGVKRLDQAVLEYFKEN